MKRFLCVLAAILPFALVTPSAKASGPSLVVVIAVDQMRADYLTRYGSLFEHGLKRLTSEGAWYQDAAYPYMSTFTCVGHTTIATGTLPYKHGIIDNTWYDRARQKTVTCTDDPAAKEVPYGAVQPTAGDSAHNMFQPSLAELMRRNTNARVATMSLKARSAIGLAGHAADSVTWFDERGAWETSTAFAQAPLPWLAKFITAHPIEADAGKDWERSLPADRYTGDDDAAGERGPAGWGRTFPHPLGKAGDRGFYTHWEDSPYPDEYLERMAEATIDDLELGHRNGVADYLGISFSALDLVGHAYGPNSHEVQDLLVRLDATIGRLLDALDTKIGKGKYVLALSADHGVAEVPEQVKAGGGRIDAKAISTAVDNALKQELGVSPVVATTIAGDVYFKPELAERVTSTHGALDKAIAAIGAMPGVARVFRGSDLERAAARRSNDPQVRAAALSYFRSRSGDLVVLPKENWEITGSATSHGTLYAYDQHVPVILFGPAFRGGARHGAATPADIAPTLGALVGVTLPAPDGHVLRAK